jgi:hypothetical protein
MRQATGTIVLIAIIAIALDVVRNEPAEKTSAYLSMVTSRIGIKCVPAIEQYHEKIDDAGE